MIKLKIDAWCLSISIFKKMFKKQNRRISTLAYFTLHHPQIWANTNYKMFYLTEERRLWSPGPDFSGHRSTVCRRPALFLLSHWSHQISMQELFCLVVWLAGWADFPHISGDAMEPDQSPKTTLWGLTVEGGKGRSREASVQGGYLHAGWQAMHQKMTALPFFLK